MTDGPVETPAQQPYLHDLQTTVRAPVFGLSGTGGALSGHGVAGVFADDRRVLSVSDLTLSGARLVPIAGELDGADATRSVLVARGLGEDGADPAVWIERRRVLVDEAASVSGFQTVVRETIEIRSAARRRVRTTLTVTLGCDLAEISAVKSGHSPAPLPAEALDGGLRWTGPGVQHRDIVQHRDVVQDVGAVDPFPDHLGPLLDHHGARRERVPVVVDLRVPDRRGAGERRRGQRGGEQRSRDQRKYLSHATPPFL